MKSKVILICLLSLLVLSACVDGLSNDNISRSKEDILNSPQSEVTEAFTTEDKSVSQAGIPIKENQTQRVYMDTKI